MTSRPAVPIVIWPGAAAMTAAASPLQRGAGCGGAGGPQSGSDVVARLALKRGLVAASRAHGRDVAVGRVLDGPHHRDPVARRGPCGAGVGVSGALGEIDLARTVRRAHRPDVGRPSRRVASGRGRRRSCCGRATRRAPRRGPRSAPPAQPGCRSWVSDSARRRRLRHHPDVLGRERRRSASRRATRRDSDSCSGVIVSRAATTLPRGRRTRYGRWRCRRFASHPETTQARSCRAVRRHLAPAGAVCVDHEHLLGRVPGVGGDEGDLAAIGRDRRDRSCRSKW